MENNTCNDIYIVKFYIVSDNSFTIKIQNSATAYSTNNVYTQAKRIYKS